MLEGRLRGIRLPDCINRLIQRTDQAALDLFKDDARKLIVYVDFTWRTEDGADLYRLSVVYREMYCSGRNYIAAQDIIYDQVELSTLLTSIAKNE